MSAIVLFLILLSFLEATILPGPWVLVALIARSFIIDSKSNYYLAFAFGLLIALLTATPLGILSLIYLIIVKIVHLLSKLPFSSKWWMVVPICLVMLILAEGLQSLVFHYSINFIQIILQTIASVPLYFLLRIWEERFYPQKEVRLKI
ncbi:hypothetical protein M1563_04860 [Patescibacteria group bacterium]|nr:hypothetical protein [Patescibacteria group bacterium]MCL5409467.1 hypothetical protein [Patescibacteria group bacterium]